MNDFFQIDPTAHEIGRTLIAQVDAIETFPYALKTSGWVSVNTMPFIDRPHPGTSYAGVLNTPYVDFPGCVWGCGNYFPEGGGMDWHTDSHRPGWRVYVHKLFSGDALMYYGTRVFRETPGIGAYVFRTGPGCWHAVETTGPRVSLGLKIPEVLALQLFPE